MASPIKADKHEMPDLTELESENSIVRKKSKGREKQPFTEFEVQNKTVYRKVKSDSKGLLPGISA